MAFEQIRMLEKTGKKFGFIFGYLMFTTVLFLILTVSHKIPNSWTLIHIIIITLVITLAGLLTKRLLK